MTDSGQEAAVSATVLVVPVDEDLHATLVLLGELVGWVATDLQLEGAEVALASEAVADLVARLCAATDPQRANAAVPKVAASGYELVPVAGIATSGESGAELVAALEALSDPMASESVVAVVEERSGTVAGGVTELRDRLLRLAALVEVDHGEDVRLVVERLDTPKPPEVAELLEKGWHNRPGDQVGRWQEQVLLLGGEVDAYRRISDRIIASWHGGSPIEALLYGTGDPSRPDG